MDSPDHAPEPEAAQTVNSEGTPDNTPTNASAKAEPDREDAMLFCPVCSRRLTSRKCKLLCEQCGYYMSCADYY
jgi:hypothetical protein